MNKVIMTNAFLGKKGVELKMVTGGKAVATFSIAVKKDFKEKEYNFFNCILWGKAAEFLANNQEKIKKVGIEGRIENRDYEKDGVKKYVTEIICNNLEVEEWKAEDEQQNNNSIGATGAKEIVDDSDIPF